MNYLYSLQDTQRPHIIFPNYCRLELPPSLSPSSTLAPLLSLWLFTGSSVGSTDPLFMLSISSDTSGTSSFTHSLLGWSSLVASLFMLSMMSTAGALSVLLAAVSTSVTRLDMSGTGERLDSAGPELCMGSSLV